MFHLSDRALLTYLKQRTEQQWLVNYDSRSFYLLTQKIFSELIRFSPNKIPLKVILVDQEPWNFLASLLAGITAKCHIFLANSSWQKQEWEKVFTLVNPDFILGISDQKIRAIARQSIPNNPQSNIDPSLSPLIMIPTGGSSGEIRFAIHTWETLITSVFGCYQYFDSKPINSFCILPLCHVSGLMQFLRSFLTGGNFFFLPYKQFKQQPDDLTNLKDFFISLVPTQLQFLLQSNPDWLSQFQTVFLGGAPAWQSLINQARNHQIKLSPSYGMTETAAQIVTLKPEEFCQGNQSLGQVLPHAIVKIVDENNNQLESEQVGLIQIQCQSLFLGYYPEFLPKNQYFLADDLGYCDREGYLYIVGRNSRKIITGGENVFPAEVESVILSTQLVEDVAVIGLSDRHWGQAVTVIYVPKINHLSSDMLKVAIADQISKFKQPKYWISLESLPRNSQGKINYQQLEAIATEKLIERI